MPSRVRLSKAHAEQLHTALEAVVGNTLKNLENYMGSAGWAGRDKSLFTPRERKVVEGFEALEAELTQIGSKVSLDAQRIYVNDTVFLEMPQLVTEAKVLVLDTMTTRLQEGKRTGVGKSGEQLAGEAASINLELSALEEIAQDVVSFIPKARGTGPAR